MTQQIKSLIHDAARRHDPWQVFTDFVAMSAISLSSAVDLRQRESREAEYLRIAGKYGKDELALFPRMLAAVVDALEADMADVLGRVFAELDFGSKWAGQFFTPDPIARMIAAMSAGPDIRALIEQRGFVRACEPAAGSGVMVIALCRELRAQGINYQQHLHVTAADIDLRAVHMAYVQLSLLHVPAVIVHGNSLSLEEWSHWYTPAHILGGWEARLRSSGNDRVPVSEAPPLSPAATSSDGDDAPTRAPRQLSLF